MDDGVCFFMFFSVFPDYIIHYNSIKLDREFQLGLRICRR